MWPRAATQNMCLSLMVLNYECGVFDCNWITDVKVLVTEVFMSEVRKITSLVDAD